MMNISDILNEKTVLVDVDAENKRQLIKKLADTVSASSDLDASLVFEALLERENLGSTGYGKGVAFPHARIEGIKTVIAVFTRLNKALDFESVDGKSVDLVACLISPENSGEDHLQMLSAFSRVLENDEVCKRIRKSKSAHEIYVELTTN